MKAQLHITVDALEDIGPEEESLEWLDKSIREKFSATTLKLPDDLQVGDTVNLGDYVKHVDLTYDEADAFTSWAVIAKVTNIAGTEWRKTVEVELCSEEEFL